MAKILLFGVSTQKDRAVRVAAEKIGVDVTAVNRRDYGQKIGTLAEISGFHKNGKIYNGPDFAMEMLGVFRNGFATGGCIPGRI